MKNILLFVLCFLVACVRFFLPHQAPDLPNLYKDLAHVLVGSLGGAWLASRRKSYLYLLVFLTFVEIFAFLTR